MKDRFYIYSGIMIAFGIALTVSSVIHILILESGNFYILGVFAAGFFIGLGLLIFPQREHNIIG